MPTHTETRTTEYSFTLEYDGESPFTIGEAVPSGVRDDRGNQESFRGSAYVVLIERVWSGPEAGSTVYVKQLPVIH